MDNFQFGAVRIASVDRAGFGIVDQPPLLLDGSAAVTDGEVNFAVRAHDQAMEVVSEKAYPNAITGLQNIFDVRNAVVVSVFERDQIRDVRKINAAVAREHAGRDPIFNAVVAFGKDC